MQQKEGASMPERITGRARTIVLMVVLLAAFMDLMDVTILNVMRPTIEAGLPAGPAALEWVLSGYTLALTVGLISGARLGDLLGHKRVFVSATWTRTPAAARCRAGRGRAWSRPRLGRLTACLNN
jgi:MFS family permease